MGITRDNCQQGDALSLFINKSNPLKATSVQEIIRWYSVWIEVENTFGDHNRNLEVHLDEPKKEAKAKAESNEEPIPVQYIPRKPNPNGLLVYTLATYVRNPLYDDSKLPFIVDYGPHLTAGDSSPQGVLKEFLNRWDMDEKPCVIGDAAFGSEEMINFISEWGSTATFSINLTQKHFLWSMLRSDLPPDHWKYAVIKENKIYACLHCLISSSNSIIYQQIMTTMIAGNEDESESNSEQSEESEDDQSSLIPNYTQETLEQMNVKALKEITRKFNIKQGKRKADFISNILKRVSSAHKNRSVLKQLMRRSVLCPIHRQFMIFMATTSILLISQTNTGIL